MDSKFYTPEYWRERAEEARAVAEQFRHARGRRIMLEIAQGYEEMAKAAEQLIKSEQVLARSVVPKKARS